MSDIQIDITLGGIYIIFYIEIRKALPEHLFKKSEARFLVSVFQSTSLFAVLAYIGYNYLPLTWEFLPIWVLYDFLLGTVAMGICKI